MNGADGMRTPGIAGDVAQPSAMVQWTRNGVVKTSRRKPSPGRMHEKPWGWADDVGELHLEEVARARALDQDGAR